MNLKSISQRCYFREVAFAWESTKETIYLPLGRLQIGLSHTKLCVCLYLTQTVFIVVLQKPVPI